jgi:hypothetical protein
MTSSTGKSAGAALVCAPAFSVSPSPNGNCKIDPTLELWRTRPLSDEAALREIRIATAENLRSVFPYFSDSEIGELSTALLNGMPIAQLVNLNDHVWLLDPSDMSAENARLSFLWIGAIEGNHLALGLLARMIETSPRFSGTGGMIDRLSALSAIATAAAHAAAELTIEHLPERIPEEIIDILEADSDDAFVDDHPTTAACDAPSSFIVGHEFNGELPAIYANRALLETAEKSLSERFPWMAEIAKTLLQTQYLGLGANPVRFPPTLLVGPSGTAKTSFARALAEATGIPTFYVSAAGKTGALEITGSSRTYANATTSVGVKAMATHRCRNPLIIIDEVESFGHSLQNGDPYKALATMIESHTARAYIDDYLERPVDISLVSWLFTANATEPLQGAFLDRVEIFRVARPSAQHFPAIFRNLLREIALDHNVAVDDLPELSPALVRALKDSFRDGVSLRRVKGAMTKSLQIAARHTQS